MLGASPGCRDDPARYDQRIMTTFDQLWERHKNPWSWVARPLLGALLLYGAWLNSVALVILSVIGLATSWFWFPRPSRVHPYIERFIDVERRFITPPYTGQMLICAGLVVGVVGLATAALWLRHVVLGLSVFMAGAVAKSVWSLVVAGRAGVPAAVIGAITAAGAGIALAIVLR